MSVVFVVITHKAQWTLGVAKDINHPICLSTESRKDGLKQGSDSRPGCSMARGESRPRYPSLLSPGQFCESLSLPEMIIELQVFDALIRLRCWLRRALFVWTPSTHAQRAALVQEAVRAWGRLPLSKRRPMCTAKPNWLSLSTTFFRKVLAFISRDHLLGSTPSYPGRSVRNPAAG
jgi:hypothetical protein